MSAAPTPLNVAPTADVCANALGEPVLVLLAGGVEAALPVLPAKVPVLVPRPVLPVKLFPALPVVDTPLDGDDDTPAPVLPELPATKLGAADELACTRPK